MQNLLATFTHWRPSEKSFVNYLSIVAAIYLIWLGSLKMTVSEIAQINYWLGASPLFSPILSWLGVETLAALMLVIEVSAGVFILLGMSNARPVFARLGFLGSALAGVMFLLNFTYLFTNPIWVDELGGFPYLKTGFNIVKYPSMFVVVAYIAIFHLEKIKPNYSLERFKSALTGLAFVGVIMIMGWIGALKFVQYEAEGIYGLMSTNILFSWMYDVWSVQGASNVIGVVELTFLALLLAFPFNRTLGRVGVLGIVATTLGTQSFLVSLPGWNESAYFPLINERGVFFIKDHFLVACSLILAFRYSEK